MVGGGVGGGGLKPLTISNNTLNYPNNICESAFENSRLKVKVERGIAMGDSYGDTLYIHKI